MDDKLTKKQLDTIREIRNWLVHKGRTPSVRELMAALGYKSPRSAALIIDELVQKKILAKRADGTLQLVKSDTGSDSTHARTVNVPLVGTVACGAPILAYENIEGLIPVSVTLARPSYKYFLLKAQGDSMNMAGINDGDLVLVRQQNVAENGDKVVALIDDEATIKEFHHNKGVVVLKPRSTNKEHQPIILTDNFEVQGVVVATIPNLEE
jgi:repressor LexA